MVSSTTTNSKYYYFGTSRIAARIGSTTPSNGTLFYMQGDHLGSSSLLMTSGGALNTRQTYFPFGAKRVFDGSALPTDYTFTGQKSDDSTGLIFYNARYYDATLGRFTQADSIVPNPSDPQSLNRYSYVRNNPINLIDPSGHADCAPEDSWCWENRWYEAHGQCWSDAKQGWSKSCTPEFQDSEILKQVLQEIDGLGIVLQAAPANIIGMLLNVATDPDVGELLPNFLVLGARLSPGLGPFAGAVYGQIAIDFKHRQVGFFWGIGGGVSIGVTPASISVGGEAGLGYCTNVCKSLYDYAGYGVSAGGSAYAALGGGVDVNFSADLYNSAGYSIPYPNQRIMYGSVTGGTGVAGELHALATLTFPVGEVKTYSSLQSFQTDLYNYTVQFTGDFSLARSVAVFAGYVPYEVPIR